MKSLKWLGREPASLPILADDMLEFHAARILLLLHFCGVAGRIDGLTKMAKLDFFVRYPQFFEKLCRRLGGSAPIASAITGVESSMVRFHYGPWDKRYYHVLAYLESTRLMTVSRQGNGYRLELTDKGKGIVGQLAVDAAFADLIEQMKQVKRLLGNKAGSTLKNLVYQQFGDEVADRPLGEVIY